LSIYVVLPAAGSASRYGSPKLLERIGSVSLIRHAVQAALATDASVLVVTGACADRISAELAGLPARLVHNAAWMQGMGGSIASAFRVLIDEPDVEAAIVCPADLPLVGTEQLQRLIDAHRAAPSSIVVADLGAAQGPPCLFPRSWFARLAELSGPWGARGLIADQADAVVPVPMPEAAADVDTPEDLARLRARRVQDA
jgi:molybdenum cofactor cytidylyltransferase